MNDQDWLAAQFQAHRPRLRAVAYRMLGSASEADDAVQGAWLRLSHADLDGVRNLGGWLTTLVARECLDLLRARTTRREQPVGTHLPDPVVRAQDGGGPRAASAAGRGGRAGAAGGPGHAGARRADRVRAA